MKEQEKRKKNQQLPKARVIRMSVTFSACAIKKYGILFEFK